MQVAIGHRPPVIGHAADTLGQAEIAGDYRATVAQGAEVLTRVEAEPSGDAHASRAGPAMPGAVSLRGVLNEGQPAMDASGNITWTQGNISLFSIGGDGSLAYQLSYPSQGMGSIRLALSTSGTFLYVLDQYQPGTTSNVTPGTPAATPGTPCFDSTNHVYRPAGDITVFSIDASTGRLFVQQNSQQNNALGTPLSYFPVGCGPIDFHLGSNYLYTAEASDPATGNTQVVYAYSAAATGQLIQVPGGAQPIGTSNMAASIMCGSTSRYLVAESWPAESPA